MAETKREVQRVKQRDAFEVLKGNSRIAFSAAKVKDAYGEPAGGSVLRMDGWTVRVRAENALARGSPAFFSTWGGR